MTAMPVVPRLDVVGNSTGRMALAASSLLFVALVSQAGAFTYHWELDETPQGSDRVSQVRPVQVLLSDQLLEIAPHSASLQLMKKYSVHLGEEWGFHSAGVHQMQWDGRDDEGRTLGSGVYVYRLVTPEATFARKLTMVR